MWRTVLFSILASGVAAAEEPVGDAPEPAAEEKKPPKVSATFSNDLEIRYHWITSGSPDPEFPNVRSYVEQVDRFTATIGFGEAWKAYVQMDQVMLAMNRYKLDGDGPENIVNERELLQPSLRERSFWPGFSYVTPEKVALTYSKGDAQVTIGDFYASFGRGSVLNVNRSVDIDIDTSIQGVKAVFRPGAWDITFLAGQLNRQQVFQDNPNINLLGDYRHAVMGARVERFGLGPANVGAHAVMYDFVDEPGWIEGFEELGTAPDVIAAGATVEALGVLGLDWYAEGNGYVHPTSVVYGGEGQAPGYSAYLAATAYAGISIWQFEAKRYKNSQRINTPLTLENYSAVIAPTLEYERAITEDSAAALASNDIWGGRMRVDLAVADQTTPYVSLAAFYDQDRGPLHFNFQDELIIHGLAGIEVLADKWSVMANAGVRVDERVGEIDDSVRGTSLDGLEDLGRDMQIHGDVDLKFPTPLGTYAAVQIGVEYFLWGENIVDQQNYFEMETAVTVNRGKWSLTWFTDVTTNPLINTIGNLDGDKVYGSAELQFKPTTAWTVKLFGGAYKSGIRCSGGQCRVLPGYSGGRLTVTGLF